MSEVCGEHKYDEDDFQWCPFCEIDRLRAEVERLKSREITDEQIDRAWQKLRKYKESSEFKDTLVWSALGAVLEVFGIVECPECGGRGDNGNPHYWCQRCFGHGWIREEHGDE
jgi:hypothetical protein